MKYRVYDKNKKQFLHPSLITLDPWGKVYEQIDGGCAIHSDAIIQLSTGVKDCNGKEIFEGDIVETLNNKDELLSDLPQYENGVIVFICSAFRIQERNIGATGLDAFVICGCCNQNLRVIGNIFENKK